MEGRDLIIEYMFKGKAKEFFAEKILEANVLVIPEFESWLAQGREFGLSDMDAESLRRAQYKRLVYSILDKDKIKDYPQVLSIVNIMLLQPYPKRVYNEELKDWQDDFSGLRSYESSYYIIAQTICYPPPTYTYNTYKDGIKLLSDANINISPGSMHDYIMSAIEGLKPYFDEVRYWLNLLILDAREVQNE